MSSQQICLTPQGEFRVVEKARNPRWVIPESIREERIRETGASEKFIEGGSPDNPLGEYRLRLCQRLPKEPRTGPKVTSVIIIGVHYHDI